MHSEVEYVVAHGIATMIDRNYRFVIGFNGALILFGALGTLPPATSALMHNTSTILFGMDCMTNLLKDGKKP
jgi:cation transport ATPase